MIKDQMGMTSGAKNRVRCRGFVEEMKKERKKKNTVGH